MKTCPCGSQNEFDVCCHKFLSGEHNASTPEELMRSRYSAYTLADIPYIQKTMCGKAAENYDADSARQWAQNVKWLGLSVVHSEMTSPDKGFVEFIARFKSSGKAEKIHEKSEFNKIEGLWFYVDGFLVED